MSEREISAAERAPFFDHFSKLHAGAFVTLRIKGRDEVRDQPFRGLIVDGDDVVVATGDPADEPCRGHRIVHVRSVRLEQTDEGADAAIAMLSDEGTRTEVRFRSPMQADLLEPAVE